MYLASSVVLVEREEIIAYCRTLFRTPEVLASFDDPDGYIRAIIEKFAEVPRVFMRMSHPSFESSHFTTWFGIMALRDYESDGISDVYYLHEIWHAATMTYERDMPWNRWYTKMGLNELESALHSEVIVYLMLPGLRKRTFNHEIWADRFMGMVGASSAYQVLSAERRRVMVSPDPYDFLELQIAMYGRQNLHWASIWKKNYNQVETHMANLIEMAKEDRAKAMQYHLGWLNGLTEQEDFENGIVFPFANEAVAFQKVAAENKDVYGNYLLA